MKEKLKALSVADLKAIILATEYRRFRKHPNKVYLKRQAENEFDFRMSELLEDNETN